MGVTSVVELPSLRAWAPWGAGVLVGGLPVLCLPSDERLKCSDGPRDGGHCRIENCT